MSGLPSSYNLSVAAGVGPGVVALSVNHVGTTFVTGAPSAALVEVDFHVLPTAASGNGTLLDLQGTYVDYAGNLHNTIIKDKGAISYRLVPVPLQYPSNVPLTQSGATTPASFSPSDTDATDASIQIVAGKTPLAPTTAPSTFNTAPNIPVFPSTMAVTGSAYSVLTNDTPTVNGPMYAVLTGPGVTATILHFAYIDHDY